MSQRPKRGTNKAKQAEEEDKFVNQEPPIKKRMKKDDLQELDDIANLLRIDSIKSTNVTKSGHPTSCASIAELMSALFFHESGVHFHPDQPDHFQNDRFILSKGHAAPILYAALARAGVFSQDELLSLRKKGALLQGHPVPTIPFVDVATGSLGMGLGFGAGMAYSSKYYDKIDNKTFVLMGDGEVAQGSIWEAAAFASYYKLNNLIGILDVNALGQSDKTMYAHNDKVYIEKFKAFGWDAIKIDGHSCSAIVKALAIARNQKNKPTILIAKTFKGKGFNELIEGKEGWHGKALGLDSEKTINFILESIKNPDIKLEPTKPKEDDVKLDDKKVVLKPNFSDKKPIATRKAYGKALLQAYESNNSIVALDGDTKNSTFSDTLRNKHKQAHIECFIAEQNMVAVGIGLSTRRKIPFISTFSAFFSRAADFIRIAGISQSNIKMAGSHCGVSIGEDGPTQMALEDIAFIRTIPNMLFLYPSDGVSTYRAVELAANYKGPSFIRTSRPETAILYTDDQSFEIGKCKVVKQSAEDKLLIVSSGITLHQGLRSANKLGESGTNIRVLDLFSLKPVDQDGLIKNALAAGKVVLTIEDHYKEGGIHDLVSSAVSLQGIPVHGIYVTKIPTSATPEEEIEMHGLDSTHISAKIKEILGL